jgi:hypothetical protein
MSAAFVRRWLIAPKGLGVTKMTASTHKPQTERELKKTRFLILANKPNYEKTDDTCQGNYHQTCTVF